VLDFEGDRSLNGMIDYLKENTSHPWVDAQVEEEIDDG